MLAIFYFIKIFQLFFKKLLTNKNIYVILYIEIKKRGKNMKINNKNIYDFMGGYFYQYGNYIPEIKLTNENKKMVLINKDTNTKIFGINNIIKEIKLKNYIIEK